jgi:hypothetical protein
MFNFAITTNSNRYKLYSECDRVGLFEQYEYMA